MKKDYKDYYPLMSYRPHDEWYDGVYIDSVPCCRAARSFEMLHGDKPRECWLLIHGYRGYPGELVRPAAELFDLGFDVYVPRLPGHGTTGEDFIHTRKKDWLGFAENALSALKREYDTVNILAHSMGTAIAAVLNAEDDAPRKVVYACPCLSNSIFTKRDLKMLRLAAPFRPKVEFYWHSDPSYRMHYENAPCDDERLGREYWSWYFTKQLLELNDLILQGADAFASREHDHLIIYPLGDTEFSAPSVKLCRERVKGELNVAQIPGGTHYVFYDPDPAAEDAAAAALAKYAKK